MTTAEHDWIYRGTAGQRCLRCGVLASYAPLAGGGSQAFAACPGPVPTNRQATTNLARATKDEVLARLDEAHVALVCAAETMARRYGSSPQVQQICGAAALITDDWMPMIREETDP